MKKILYEMAVVLLLVSCDMFTTSIAESAGRDPSSTIPAVFDVPAARALVAAAKADPKLSLAALEKIVSVMPSADPADRDQYRVLAIQAANEASGVSTALLANSGSLLYGGDINDRAVSQLMYNVANDSGYLDQVVPYFAKLIDAPDYPTLANLLNAGQAKNEDLFLATIALILADVKDPASGTHYIYDTSRSTIDLKEVANVLRDKFKAPEADEVAKKLKASSVDQLVSLGLSRPDVESFRSTNKPYITEVVTAYATSIGESVGAQGEVVAQAFADKLTALASTMTNTNINSLTAQLPALVNSVVQQFPANQEFARSIAQTMADAVVTALTKALDSENTKVKAIQDAAAAARNAASDPNAKNAAAAAVAILVAQDSSINLPVNTALDNSGVPSGNLAAAKTAYATASAGNYVNAYTVAVQQAGGLQTTSANVTKLDDTVAGNLAKEIPAELVVVSAIAEAIKQLNGNNPAVDALNATISKTTDAFKKFYDMASNISTAETEAAQVNTGITTFKNKPTSTDISVVTTPADLALPALLAAINDIDTTINAAIAAGVPSNSAVIIDAQAKAQTARNAYNKIGYYNNDGDRSGDYGTFRQRLNKYNNSSGLSKISALAEVVEAAGWLITDTDDAHLKNPLEAAALAAYKAADAAKALIPAKVTAADGDDEAALFAAVITATFGNATEAIKVLGSKITGTPPKNDGIDLFKTVAAALPVGVTAAGTSIKNTLIDAAESAGENAAETAVTAKATAAGQAKGAALEAVLDNNSNWDIANGEIIPSVLKASIGERLAEAYMLLMITVDSKPTGIIGSLIDGIGI
ncbi:hypothetical protein FACS1894164_02090 [Spirochaetia bacterium]|nr:hypothetical protein FACS1894164_02090 [Spirochaetia bacterium]